MAVPTIKLYDDSVELRRNLSTIKRERSQLEARLTAIRRIEQEVRVYVRDIASDFHDESDEWEGLLGNIEAVEHDILSYLTHINTEIDKIHRGIDALELLRDTEGRRVLATYIQEDTELSIANIGKTISHYSEVIDSLRVMRGLMK